MTANQKTEHVQANIPTLPSGGGLPLDVFAPIPGAQQLEILGVTRLDGHQEGHCKYFTVLSLCVHLTFITGLAFSHVPTGLLAP